MKTVFKYALKLTGELQALSIPKAADVNLVGVQREQICLWMQVDTSQPIETRHFAVYGTGCPLPPSDCEFIGSVVAEPFVWHVYEVKNR